MINEEMLMMTVMTPMTVMIEQYSLSFVATMQQCLELSRGPTSKTNTCLVSEARTTTKNKTATT